MKIRERFHLGVLLMAQRGCCLESGRVVLADTARNLTSNERVRHAHVGG